VALPLKAKASHKKTAGIVFTSRGIALAIIDHDHIVTRLLHAKFYPCGLTEHNSVLSGLSKTHQLHSIPCNFVLNPDEYQTFQVEKPQVDKQEMQAALRWHIKDLIDFHIDDVVLDFISLPVENMPLQVIATRKSVIQSRVDALHDANCQLETIDIATQAARNLIDKVKSVSAENSIGLLNLWETGAKISVLVNHDLYINRLTHIGADALSAVSEEERDSQDIVDALAIELQRTFDYFESYSRQAPVNQLLIMSNTRPIAQLDAMIQQRLGIDCQIVSLQHFNDFDIDVTMHSSDEIPDACLLAMGGALRSGH
jgi:MSHA biogenesis protein MshI